MATRYLAGLNKSGKPLKVEVVANSQQEAKKKAVRENPGYKPITVKNMGKA